MHLWAPPLWRLARFEAVHRRQCHLFHYGHVSYCVLPPFTSPTSPMALPHLSCSPNTHGSSPSHRCEFWKLALHWDQIFKIQSLNARQYLSLH